MTAPKTYPHGVPSWVDTVAHDLDEAKRFYAGLFDWTFTDAMPAEAPGNYLIATIGGEDVAAIGSPTPTTRSSVAHLHRRRRRRRHREGRRGRGRHRHAGPGRRRARRTPGGVRRPARRRVPLWQARKRLGAQLVNVPGTWNFSDLHTTDPHEAATFYSTVFGWEVDDVGYATMVRRPGYGDHLAADRRPRHQGAASRGRRARRVRGRRRLDATRSRRATPNCGR